jgi:pyridoxal/pyridoxine/pyridoxamine kinase
MEGAHAAHTGNLLNAGVVKAAFDWVASLSDEHIAALIVLDERLCDAAGLTMISEHIEAAIV